MNRAGNERLLGIATVLIAAILWGTTGTAATFAPEVSAVAIGAVAMGGGGLLQALLAARRIRRHASLLRAQWRCLLLGAIAVAIYPLAFYASMRLAGVTIGTAVSIGSAPLLSALIEYRLDGLRLTKRWMSGAGLGLTGMLLLCLAEGSGHVPTGTDSGVIPGVLLGLLAGLSYALYSWTARRLMQCGIASRAAMGATFGIGGLMLMPVLFITGAPLLASWGNATVGLYMALVPMLLGYLCFGYGLARIPASTATTITLFEPVVAAGLAVVIVGERLPAMGWVGIGLILACLVCISAPVNVAKRQAVCSTPHVGVTSDR
ncbi:DMT family transporter [Halomonas korlensis]|uniref:Drug/metabolite transporter, DME family n=1 Tax=Halomonas korlensis TaxID=463301 RepID=A0A1I7IXX2_9GAMM|nr:EamA family transporter [Halomonas korlensis]SFU77790.1 drug/metabolite transporter, DME family [Halomonas korlensis]